MSGALQPNMDAGARDHNKQQIFRFKRNTTNTNTGSRSI